MNEFIPFLEQQIQQQRHDMGIRTTPAETVQQIYQYRALKRIKEVLVYEDGHTPEISLATLQPYDKTEGGVL